MQREWRERERGTSENIYDMKVLTLWRRRALFLPAHQFTAIYVVP